MPGPLEGVRVLDFTHHLQGPSATGMLSEMGAEIWKIENRNGGDSLRHGYISEDGYAKRHETFNRGKRSITLDIRTEVGREIALQLCEHVDIVTENFRPGVMDRLGLGYEAFRARKPDIIMASASALGSEGPLAQRPGYDVIGQAMGGVMRMNSFGADQEPRTLPGSFADWMGGTQFCIAMLSAIICRDRTGVGQKVATSLYGAQMYSQNYYLQTYLHDGVQPYQKRKRSPVFTFYEARDGLWFVIGATEQKSFESLCDVLDARHLIADPRWAERGIRQDSEELEAELETRFKQQDRAYWLERIAAVDVACAPVNSYADVAVDPQAWANGYLAEVEHPRYGTINVHGVPWRFSATPVVVPNSAPELGADTDFVLGQVGFTDAEIAGFRSSDLI